MILTHKSASTYAVTNLINLIGYIYERQPSRQDACAYLDISIATFKRQVAAARYFGVDIIAVSPRRQSAETYYAVKSFGIFNKPKLLAAVT